MSVVPIRETLYDISESSNEDVVIRMTWDRDGVAYRASITTNDHSLQEMEHSTRLQALSCIARQMKGELISAEVIVPHAISLF